MAKELADTYSRIMPAQKKYFNNKLTAWNRREKKIEKDMKAFSDSHKNVSYAATEPVAYYLLSDMGFTDNTPEGYLQSSSTNSEPAPTDLQEFQELLEKHQVDLLVNNAGIYRAHCVPFAESESAFWRDKIEVNILGTMYFTRALLPGMLRRHYGRIINLASVAGVYGIANMADYSMTKGAIIGFTHALAKEVTSQGVLVNAVSPGSIDDDPASMPVHSFMGRAGSFAECAEVICFLASDAASYVAGQNYIVDGCRRKM